MADIQQAIKLAGAIARVESGGNYQARGGSGEYGAFQYMPATWKSTAKAYLGDENAPMTKGNQNKATVKKVAALLDKGYKPEQVAAVWNSGQPTWEGKVGVNKYGQKYDVPAYVNKVISQYNKSNKISMTSAQPTQQAQQPIQTSQTKLWQAIDVERKKGKTDTELLDEIKQRMPQSAAKIDALRQKAAATNRSDREVLNYLSKQISGQEPTVPSVPTREEKAPVAKQEGFLAKTAKFLAPLGESLGQGIANLSGVGKITDKATEGLIKSANTLITAAQKETDPTRKQKLLDMAKQDAERAGMNWQEVLPSIQKTNIQIAGEGAMTALNALSGGALSTGGITAVKPLATIASKVPTISRYAGYGARGAISGGLYGTASGMKEGKGLQETVKEAATGAATGAVLGLAVPAVFEGGSRLFKNVASKLSGVPKEAIQEAFRNPQKIASEVKNYVKNPETKNNILINAEKSFDSIKRQRSQNYKQALNNLKNDVFITKTGQNKGRMYIRNQATNVFEPTKLTTQGVKSTLTKTLKDYNLKILTTAEQNQVKELQKLVKNWDDFTPTGIDDLRKAISNRKTHTNSKYLNGIYAKMENNVANYIDSRVPQIGTMKKQYAMESKFIDLLKQEIFGKTSTMSQSSKLQRLMSIFNEKNPLRKELVKELGEQTANDFISEIAAAMMTDWLPKGLSANILSGLGGAGIIGGAIVNPLAAVPSAIGGAITSSPRMVGVIARTAGRVSQLGARLVK